MRILATNSSLLALKERLERPEQQVEIQLYAQKQRLDEHQALEMHLAASDREVVRLNILLERIAQQQGHKYSVNPQGKQCLARFFERKKGIYSGVSLETEIWAVAAK